MKNAEIANIFREIATILEIKGDNRFKIRAYERAAQNIEGLSEDIETYANNNTLRTIPGIGHDLEERIKEYLDKGKIKYYQTLKKSLPSGLLELLNISSIGPKTTKLLYDELKIKNIAGLERAIRQNKLTSLPGIKEKTIENITKGIELFKRGKERMPLYYATQIADKFITQLKKLPEVKKISVAGSLRRCKETVRDIDILVISKKPQTIIKAFTAIPLVKDVLAKGNTKASIRTGERIQVDCRVLDEKSFGAALVYFTGSKNFNIKLRQMAIKKGLKVNEYGIFSANKFGGSKEKFVCGKNEEEVFKTLGLEYIPPEICEDTGEIELSLQDKLPRLIEAKDIKGDLHAHSSWSDGVNTIEEMAQEAKRIGYSYVCITDHSQSIKIAGGLSISDLNKKRKEIDKINSRLYNFRVLYGTEVDITSDGKIDYPDKVLSEFDIVIAAIHTGFKQSKEQITKRLTSACKNKYVHIIAHPTGRLWGTRDSYEIEWNEFLKTARDTNTALELNSFPQRLDLNDYACRRAKEMGIKIAIDTDSHSTEHLSLIKFGISTARRGWITKEDVINTLAPEQLLKQIKKS